MNSKLCAYWAHKQGLLSVQTDTNREVLAATGWARSVGGHNPYMTLFARNRSTKAQADQDAQALDIYEFACARGCTHVLAKDHFKVGIKAGQGFNDVASIRTAKNKLGVTDEEIATLKQGILDALKGPPLSTGDLKKALGSLIVNYGEAGKKIGQTTNLSLGLLSLQAEGRIRRVLEGGRLDGENYSYTLFNMGEEVDDTYTKDQCYEELAQAYWSWLGVASLANFQWFSGLGVGVSKKAVESLELVPLDGDLLIRQEDLDNYNQFSAPSGPAYRLLNAIDSLFLLRRNVADHVADVDAHQEVLRSSGRTRIIGMQDLPNNAIVDRGRLIGLWDYEVSSQSIVHFCFVPMNDELEQEIRLTEAFVRDQLGDCRSFSLDSPKSRQAAIEGLREMSK